MASASVERKRTLNSLTNCERNEEDEPKKENLHDELFQSDPLPPLFVDKAWTKSIPFKACIAWRINLYP